MKTFYNTLLTVVFLFIFKLSEAQTYTMNWGSSFSPAWTAGSTSSRTTTTIGGSGVTATVSFTMSEATAVSSFGGFTSPQVSSASFPFNTAVGVAQSNLALGMNLSTNAGYVEMTVSFSSAVSNIAFNIADIDKNNATSATYFDEVLITGFNGITAVTNPTLSKLNGTAVNNTTDTVLISGNIARANAVTNRGGNTASDLTDQNGTVRVVFGNQAMTRVVIRYRNATGAQANPAQQAIGIGNFNFTNFVSLPVQLLSFSANYKNGVALIDWATTQEMSTKSFVIEKSLNGQDWTVVDEVAAAGVSTTVRNYQVKDLNPAKVNLYRIKQIDIDGKVNYSKIITLKTDVSSKTSLQVFPNPAQNNASVLYTSVNKGQVVLTVFNSNGVQVNSVKALVNEGNNSIALSAIQQLSKGMYTITLYNQTTGQKESIQLVKL